MEMSQALKQNCKRDNNEKEEYTQHGCNDWKNIQSCAENTRVLVVAVVNRYYRDMIVLVKHATE